MSALDRIEQEDFGQSRWVLIPNLALPMCRFAVAFPGGAHRDPIGAAGAHRAMAELILRGTVSMSRSVFHERLEQLGSSLYASTSGDSIVFRGTCLSRNLSATLDLLADALISPAFDDSELGLLRDEMRDGLENERDDDATVAETWFRRTLLFGTPYARRGHGELIELAAITISMIRELHRRYILENACIFIGLGDFERPLIKNFVQRVGGGELFSVPELAFPNPESPRVVLVDQPDQEQVELRLGCLTVNGNHPDLTAFWLGTTAFAGTFSSPFSQEIREKRGWSYSAHVEFSRYSMQRSAWTLLTAPSLDDAADCLALELQLFREFAAGLLADEAIEFARRYLLNRHALSTASAHDLLTPLLYLSLLGQSPATLAGIPDRLASCTNDDVCTAVRATLAPRHLVAVLVGDVAKKKAAVSALFPEARVSTVQARAT